MKIDRVQKALKRMSREQRAKALLALCLRIAETGWKHMPRGRGWKDALKRRGRVAARRGVKS